MAKSTDFERIKGDKARRYRNKKTGEEISRRQWLQIKAGTTLEAKARSNRETNRALSELRPARGRKSALKATPTEQAIIAEARIEDRAQRTAIAKKNKLVEKQRRRVRAKKFNARDLNPRHQAFRMPFNDYKEYQTIRRDAERSGKVLSYSLGIIGFKENSLDIEERGITVFTLTDIKYEYPEDEFNERMLEEMEERSYFQFSHFFIHLHFKKEYWQPRMLRAKNKSRSLF